MCSLKSSIVIISKASLSDCFIQHNHFIKKIHLHNDSVLFVCQHCFLNIIFCVIMSLHSQYTVCTQYSYECVDLFWKFLNCIHTKLFFKLVAAEKKQIQLFIKIIHLQKVLNQSQNYIEQNILCFAEELTDDNDETENENENLFLTSQLFNSLSSFFWKSIFIFSQNIEAFLHSSWDCSWVFKCFLRYYILFT